MKQALVLALIVVLIWFVAMYFAPEVADFKCDMDTQSMLIASGIVFASSLLGGFVEKKFDLAQYI